jgi:hypothetical protein
VPVRTRSEIQQSVRARAMAVDVLQLEVLLDIRELLQEMQGPIVNLDVDELGTANKEGVTGDGVKGKEKAPASGKKKTRR